MHQLFSTSHHCFRVIVFAPKAKSLYSWWRHKMETFSALLVLCARNSPVPGDFPSQRPVTQSFDVFFDLRQNKRLSKQSWGWWFETPLRPSCRHCNVTNDDLMYWHIYSSKVSVSYLIEAEWRIYASVNYAIILYNNLSPVRCQAIIRINGNDKMIKLESKFQNVIQEKCRSLWLGLNVLNSSCYCVFMSRYCPPTQTR